MAKSIPLAVAIAALLAQPALAQQTPAEKLAARWGGICATAIDGTLLFLRCTETFNSNDPLAFLIAARGQRLDEIPGQARVATRDISQVLPAMNLDVGGHNFSLQFGTGLDGSLSLDADSDETLSALWSLHFSADVGRINRRAGRNEAAFDARSGSFTAGIDRQFGPNWQVGLTLNHASEDLDFSVSDSKASTRFTGAFLTASRSLGDTWSASGYYGRFNGQYDLSRNISYTLPLPSGPINISAEATANPDASRRVSGLAVNGQWANHGWDLGFGAGMDKNETTIEPYTESGGGGLALSVPGRTVSTRRGRVDFTLGRTYSNSRGVFQPSLRVGWRKEFDNPRRAVTVRLAQDPLQNAITFDTEDPDRGWGEVALGGVMTFTGGHSGFFELRQRVSHSFLQERMLAIGWRMEL